MSNSKKIRMLMESFKDSMILESKNFDIKYAKSLISSLNRYFNKSNKITNVRDSKLSTTSTNENWQDVTFYLNGESGGIKKSITFTLKFYGIEDYVDNGRLQLSIAGARSGGVDFGEGEIPTPKEIISHLKKYAPDSDLLN